MSRPLLALDSGPATHAVPAGLTLVLVGFLVLLIVLALEKLFTLSSSKLFGWFFWLYNAGVILTSAMLIWHGSLTVLGIESTAMIAGIAGLGHMLLTRWLREEAAQ